MAQRSSLSGRSPFCQLRKKKLEKDLKTSRMICVTSNKLCMSAKSNKTWKKHGTNRGQERRQPHRGCLKNNSIGGNLPVPSDQGTLGKPEAGGRDHACQMVQSGL